MKKTRHHIRHHRRRRVRAKISGTATVPRLSVFRSLRHLYVQVIDDTKGHTLLALTTKGSEYGDAEALGTAVGKACLAAGIEQVVYDRGGYRYAGNVQRLADAARAAGLKF